MVRQGDITIGNSNVMAVPIEVAIGWKSGKLAHIYIYNDNNDINMKKRL